MLNQVELQRPASCKWCIAAGFLIIVLGALTVLPLALLWAFSQIPEVEREIDNRQERGIYE